MYMVAQLNRQFCMKYNGEGYDSELFVWNLFSSFLSTAWSCICESILESGSVHGMRKTRPLAFAQLFNIIGGLSFQADEIPFFGVGRNY